MIRSGATNRRSSSSHLRMMRLLCLAMMALGVGLALDRLSVAQVVQSVKAALATKGTDKEIAAYLKRVQLTNQLDDRTVEELQGLGAGPKTLEALRTLQAASTGLAKAPALAPAPVYKPKDPPSAAEQGKLIDEARDYALGYSKNLPNFVCLQVVKSFANYRGQERFIVSQASRLSYFDQKEKYELLRQNDQTVDPTLKDRRAPLTSSGDFGTFLRYIFEPFSEAQFEWDHWGTLRGKEMYVFNYRIAQQNSRWHLTSGPDADIIPAYRGLIYLDKETGLIMRITMKAVDIPPSFPVHDAAEILDYDSIPISDQEFLLPRKAQITLNDGQFALRNDVEFRSYRKYSADVKIDFKDIGDDVSPVEKEKPAKP